MYVLEILVFITTKCLSVHVITEFFDQIFRLCCKRQFWKVFGEYIPNSWSFIDKIVFVFTYIKLVTFKKRKRTPCWIFVIYFLKVKARRRCRVVHIVHNAQSFVMIYFINIRNFVRDHQRSGMSITWRVSYYADSPFL